MALIPIAVCSNKGVDSTEKFCRRMILADKKKGPIGPFFAFSSSWL
jgi:hypothetical protein